MSPHVCVLTWFPGGKTVCPYSVQGEPFTRTRISPPKLLPTSYKEVSYAHSSHIVPLTHRPNPPTNFEISEKHKTEWEFRALLKVKE